MQPYDGLTFGYISALRRMILGEVEGVGAVGVDVGAEMSLTFLEMENLTITSQIHSDKYAFHFTNFLSNFRRFSGHLQWRAFSLVSFETQSLSNSVIAACLKVTLKHEDNH